MEIEIGELFDHPTIASLAGQLSLAPVEAGLPPLVRQERPDRIPLSFSQERLWFIDQLEGSVQYHITTVLRLAGNLEMDALTGALQSIVNRHEVLRTVIRQDEEQHYQVILEEDQWRLEEIDASVDGKDPAALRKRITKLAAEPFNLSKDSMLRGYLLHIGGGERILLLTLHHIASDGWSGNILMNEFVELYDAFQQKRPSRLKPLDLQYADYAIWQRGWLQGNVLESKLDYWKRKLTGSVPLDLPTDYPRPAVQSSKGAMFTFPAGAELTEGIMRLSRREGVTPYMLMLAVFNVLLNKYSNQDDIVVGIPVAGRQQRETEDLIGFFVNTVAVRNDMSCDPAFTDLLHQVRRTMLEAYEHQELPFERIVQEVVKERDISRSPLFQVMFVWQSETGTPMEGSYLGGLEIAPEDAGHHTSKFDLTVGVTPQAENLNINIEYCTDLYKEATIERLSVHYKNLLHAVLENPEQQIGSLRMMGIDEEQARLSSSNGQVTTYPSHKTVVELFEEQVKRNPGAMAVVYEDKQLTYGDLDKQSNQLSRYLRKKGVGKETLVPLCLDRSTDLIVAILAVLKAGGAYVPVDPSQPVERIKHMVDDSGSGIVVGKSEIISRIPLPAKVKIIRLDRDQAMIDKQSPGALRGKPVPQDLAYVIYTSGSTGAPKGVMVEHAGVVNLIHWHQRAYNVRCSSKATVMGNIGFDAFGWEVFPYLAMGACVYIISDDKRSDVNSLTEVFMRCGITHSFVPTALVADVMDEVANKPLELQYLLTGGDRLQTLKHANYGFELINNYGPTENTVVATACKVKTGEPGDILPSIGRPIDNCSVYITDREGCLSATGIPGELRIGGAGVGRGYLNRPELTAERFVSNEYGEGRLYRTGDMGRWLGDGNIEFLGRVDEQVKIRGYRVEPGEVESELQQMADVSRAVVIAREDGMGSKQLVGYVVGINGVRLDTRKILEGLRDRLPEYMIPAVLMELAALPMTANGKLDRKGLPEPNEMISSGPDYTAPATALEQELVLIWQRLLRIERIGTRECV